MKTNQTYTLITGASMGLGKSFAIELAKQHRNLLLVSLYHEGLAQFSNTLRVDYPILVEYLEIDLAREEAFMKLANWLKPYDIDILINNAGVGGSQCLQDVGPNYINRILQINVKMVSLLCHQVLPKLKQHPKAYILNVASIAALSPIGFKTVYPASKAFIYSFSLGLCEELKSSGVSVSVILPGPMRTNADVSLRIEKQGWWVKSSILNTEEIACLGIRKLFAGVRVIIPGFMNKLNWLLIKLLPLQMSTSIITNTVRKELEEKQAVSVSNVHVAS